MTDQMNGQHIRVQSLASGSSGNALLIQHGTRAIMVDAGIGPRELTLHLTAIGLGWDRIDALFLTHEHTDHVRALPTFRKKQIPVITSAGTARQTHLKARECQTIAAGETTAIGGMRLTGIGVSHDAMEPLGVLVEIGDVRIVAMTDLGSATGAHAEIIAASDLVVIESNHDVDMLKRGPYPAYLKQRVLSHRGHLSNEDCGALLQQALETTTKPRTVWLAHLSETNNRPTLADQAASQALASASCRHAVSPLPRRQPGPVWSPSLQAPGQLRLDGLLGAHES